MSEHETILPEGWPRPRGYANGMLAAPGSRLLAIAGQVGWDEAERMVSDRFSEQFQRALENIAAIVARAGGRPSDVLRLTFFVTDRSEYQAQIAEVGRAYRGVFGHHFPACTLVEVQGLLEQGAKVEIEATAAIPPRPAAEGGPR